MKTSMKNIIWTNYYVEYEDWKDFIEEEFSDRTEDEKYCIMYEINDEYLLDERRNLDIQLNNEIIVIADLGRWNGRISGYKEINSGNISDCLCCDNDYNTWYVDKYKNLRCESIHHDGTNYYLYRVHKDNITEKQKENFMEKLYNGTVTPKDITRYTESVGKYIAEVYGF